MAGNGASTEAEPASELAQVAARLHAQRRVCFEFGLDRGQPRLNEDSLIGLGVADFGEQGFCQVVGHLLPQHTMDLLDQRPPGRGPIQRLGNRLIGRFIHTINEVGERRYQADGAVLMRSDKGEPWSAPDPQPMPVPHQNDPTSTLRLLQAPPAAIFEWHDQALDEGGRQITFQLNLARVEPLLPPEPLAKRTTGHNGRLFGHLTLSADGLPQMYAISEDEFSDTGETSWQSLRFTEFGDGCDEKDLWERWKQRGDAAA